MTERQRAEQRVNIGMATEKAFTASNCTYPRFAAAYAIDDALTACSCKALSNAQRAAVWEALRLLEGSTK